MSSSRVLGLDYGNTNTGVSISDRINMFAHELCTIRTTDQAVLLAEIIELCNANEIKKIVMGVPLNMDGSHGFQADIVKVFAGMLEDAGYDIKYIDERLTTKMSEEILADLNFSKDEIKEKSDQRAAQIILQEYLDYN